MQLCRCQTNVIRAIVLTPLTALRDLSQPLACHPKQSLLMLEDIYENA